MSRELRFVLTAGMVVIVCLAGLDTAVAQDQPQEEPDRNWSNSTELSLVFVAGNSETNNLGLRNVYAYKWDNAEFSWESGWVRASSRDGDIFAVGSSENDFDVVEPGTKIDSDRLYSKLRYQRTIRDRHYWYSSYDSARDEPSNINRQFVFSGGIGTTWIERQGLVFRTTYGANYTNEDLALEGANNFGGYRLFYRFEAQLTDSTAVESELTFDGSFKAGDDVRSDWLNGVAVAINDSIALKASLRLLFRNVPALQDIDLETPALGVVIGKVIIPKDKLDTTLAMSLVISF